MTGTPDTTRAGILFVLAAMLLISINDMLIKSLSGDYPLHELVFARTFIGIIFSFMILQLEGGIGLLRTAQPGLHALRALLVVLANSLFYAAIVVMPIATANAIYFVAPLIVTLLSIPVLGERVGPRRLAAVVAGFGGVLLMVLPELMGQAEGIGWAAVLPMLAAAGYAGMAVLTRKLGHTTRASALSIYLQAAFLIVSIAFFLIAGDGRFVDASSNDSLYFLLRPWVWPEQADLWPMAGLGLVSAGVGYTMSQAYRMANASTVAPFEYVLLIFSLFWGWTIFGEWPQPFVFAGAAVIIAAGVYIWLRDDTKVPVRRS
jgi:S-adenosylmethionine uptake transporter